jgi:hypothetical protein
MPYKPQRTLTLFPLVNFHMGLDQIILGLDSSEPHEEQIQVLRSCKLSHLVLILTVGLGMVGLISSVTYPYSFRHDQLFIPIVLTLFS